MYNENYRPLLETMHNNEHVTWSVLWQLMLPKWYATGQRIKEVSSLLW